MTTVYEYRARDAQGLEKRGLTSGTTTTAVARELAGRGWVAIDIRPQRGNASVTGPVARASNNPGAASPRPTVAGRPLAPRQLAEVTIARAAERAAGHRADSDGLLPTADAQTGGSDALSETAGTGQRRGRGDGNPMAPAVSAEQAVRGMRPGPWLALGKLRRPGRKRAQAAFGLALRELAALLRAGVPLMRALQLVAESAGVVSVQEALQRISRDLDKGHNLVQAAEHEHRASGLLTPYDIAMLKVGEQTGRLPEALSDLHRHREFTRATNEQVAAALRYPAFVILTCVLAMVVINIFVIPAFARVFAQARTPLPLLTLVLLAGSSFMLRFWPLLFAVAGGTAWGWRHWIEQPRGRLWWDRIKLRLPIVGEILLGIVLARLSASLSSSLGAGLTLTESLTVTARTLDNRWFEVKLQQMCNDLARGTSITAASRNMGVLPPTMLQLFAIGEESGSLEELMGEISQHYQSNVDFAVKRLAGTLEPILIWFLGMGVLVLALGVFMPMWDLGRSSIK